MMKQNLGVTSVAEIGATSGTKVKNKQSIALCPIGWEDTESVLPAVFMRVDVNGKHLNNENEDEDEDCHPEWDCRLLTVDR